MNRDLPIERNKEEILYESMKAWKDLRRDATEIPTTLERTRRLRPRRSGQCSWRRWMRAQLRCSLERVGAAASWRGGRRHRGRRGCARRRDCPRLAGSEDARAVLRGPGLPGPFPVQLRELAPLQYQLIKSVQTLVKPLAGDRAGRLHPDARAPRHPRQFQHAQVLFQFAHLFGTCGHREEPVQEPENRPDLLRFRVVQGQVRNGIDPEFRKEEDSWGESWL